VFESKDGGQKCNLRISGNVSWQKSCSMKGTISKKIKQAMAKTIPLIVKKLSLHVA
jgi:hypothetical protein